MPGNYRTMVKLDEYEREILRALQKGIADVTHEKLSIAKLVGAIIRSYWSDMKATGDPGLISAVLKRSARLRELEELQSLGNKSELET